MYASQPTSPPTTQHSLPGARYGLPAPVFHRLDRASFAWRTSNHLTDRSMDDVTIARSLHVLAVVLWIGGVGFMTTVLLPALRRLPNPAQRTAMFGIVERHFSAQARLSVILVGLSGLYMLIHLDVWCAFRSIVISRIG